MADTATTPKRMNITHGNVQARRNNAGTSNSDTNTTDNHNSGDSGSDNENSGRLITNGVMIFDNLHNICLRGSHGSSSRNRSCNEAAAVMTHQGSSILLLMVLAKHPARASSL